MERECSVCGSPMVRTSTGYKCSFCAHEELLSAKQTVYTSVQPNARRSEKKKPIVPIVTGIMVGVVLLIVCMAFLPMLLFMNTTDSGTIAVDVEPEYKVEEAPFEVNGFQSYTMQQVVAKMFGKPAELVTKEELESIQYLEVEVSWMEESCVVSYSTADYREYEVNHFEKIKESSDEIPFAYNEDFEETIQTVRVGYYDEKYHAVYGDLVNFSKVNALRLDDYAYVDLSLFSELRMVDTRGADMDELMESNLPIEQIEVLKATGSDLTGIGGFSSLKELYLYGNELAQLEELAGCEKLDTLYCVNLAGDMNYGTIEPLKALKTLYIDGSSDGVKDLSVIASFRELENLTITDTEIITLDFLKDLENLKTLRLSENGELRNFESLSGLLGLEYLEFNINDLHGNQPEYTELGKLKNLKSLALHTVYNLDFLYELEQLEELEIRLTFYNDLLEPIRKMTNLKKLTLAQCNSQWRDGFDCLSELPALRSLTIDQMEFEDPVDGLFTLDTLEELRITSSQFFVVPGQVVVSDKLKVLDLSYTEFITMPGYGEYVYVGYEDEAIAQGVLEHYFSATGLEELYLDYYLISDLSGLNNLSNLRVLSLQRCELTEIAEADVTGCPLIEELYLSSNQISDISFVKKLPCLEHMELRDCYVTDLTPLLDCTELKYVDIRNNPIGENPLTNVEIRE